MTEGRVEDGPYTYTTDLEVVGRTLVPFLRTLE